MTWPGERQRHTMSSRGVQTARKEVSKQTIDVGEFDPKRLHRLYQQYWVANPKIQDKGDLQEVLDIYDDSVYDFLDDNPFVIDMMVGVDTPEEAEIKVYEIWGSLEDLLDSEQWIVDVVHAAYNPNSASGVKDIFTKKGLDNYTKDDSHWNTDLADLIKKYDAKAAVFGKVVVYENYIPLFRIHDELDFFKEAEPNTLYVWNMNNLSESEFEKWGKKVKKECPNKTVEMIYDPGGA